MLNDTPSVLKYLQYLPSAGCDDDVCHYHQSQHVITWLVSSLLVVMTYIIITSHPALGKCCRYFKTEGVNSNFNTASILIRTILVGDYYNTIVILYRHMLNMMRGSLKLQINSHYTFLFILPLF